MRLHHALRAASGFAEEVDFVAHWKLDETSGTTALDSKGSNDGTYNGAPTLGQTGLINSGTAVAFDGVDDYVSQPYLINNNAGSVSVWIKPVHAAGTRHEHFIGIFEPDQSTNTSNNEQFVLQSFTDGNTYWGIQVSGTNYKIITADPWPSSIIHVVLTWDDSAGEVKLYWNATLKGTVTGFPGANLSKAPWFGATQIFDNSTSSVNRFYEGTLDDIKFWERALTAQEVTDEYNANSI